MLLGGREKPLPFLKGENRGIEQRAQGKQGTQQNKGFLFHWGGLLQYDSTEKTKKNKKKFPIPKKFSEKRPGDLKTARTWRIMEAINYSGGTHESRHIHLSVSFPPSGRPYPYAGIH